MLTVVGCADILTPEDAWYRRYGDTARVGCHKQNKTWVLKCNGNRWDGVVGTCDTSGGVVITNDNTRDGATEWSLFSLGKMWNILMKVSNQSC